MNFSPLTLQVDAATAVFNPYDRGTNGAFVYRKAGVVLNAPRVVVSTTTNDAASDKYLFQVSHPRVAPVEPGCCDVPVVLGTDFIKCDVRALANTDAASRAEMIDTMVGLLLEMKTAFQNREKVYS